MKSIIKIGSIILFLAVLIMLVSSGTQRAKWKGKIETENGIKVIKNPRGPLYGEIDFELKEDLSIGNDEDKNYQFYRVTEIALDTQENIYVLDSGNHRIQKFDGNGNYLQTIGKKGQGPGEFWEPGEFFLDDQDNIYVLDSRKIKVFNSEGNFVKNILLQNSISDFCMDIKGNIFGQASIRTENERMLTVIKMSPEGKLIKKIAEFPDVKTAVRKSGRDLISFKVYHEYTPYLYISPLDKQSFCFGFPSEYRIDITEYDGYIFLRIRKEKTPQSISHKEKEIIVKGVEERISGRGRKWPERVLEEACNFPSHRPFFKGIGVDDKQRLYVWRLKSVLDKNKEEEFDLFDKEGHYLYRIKIPFSPKIIKKSFLFDVKKDEDTGEVRVRRFRIINWNQIKEGI